LSVPIERALLGAHALQESPTRDPSATTRRDCLMHVQGVATEYLPGLDVFRVQGLARLPV